MIPLYNFKNISFGYPVFAPDTKSKNILNNLSVAIERGEYIAVLGSNGSGKSTFARLLAGLILHSGGEYYFRNQLLVKIDRNTFCDVSLVLQEPQYQVLMPTVRAELEYPLLNRDLNRDEIRRRVDETSSLFGLHHVLDSDVETISGGEMTLLAVASAVITEPEVLILDEPDSHLDRKSRRRLEDYLELVKGKMTIIYITQFPERLDSSFRAMLLEQGSVGADGTIAEVVKTYKSRSIGTDVSDRKLPDTQSKPSNSIVEVDNLSFKFKSGFEVLKNVSFNVKPGEKIAILGSPGSGKTTLGLAIAGLLDSDSGTLTGNISLSEDKNGKSIRPVMGLQFPERALIGETVENDVGLALHSKPEIEKQPTTQSLLEKFKLEKLANRHPFDLSGGEKRRTALAGLYALQSDFIILDEPTASLDIANSRLIMDHIMNDNETSYLIISHDLDFVIKFCHRVIGLKEGKVICDIPISNLDDKAILDSIYD